MKRILLFAVALVFAASAMAQFRVAAPKQLRNKAVADKQAIIGTENFSNQTIPGQIYDFWPPVENPSGYTRYDLQTNSSMQDRIYAYDDGTIGMTFTFGTAETSFPERGTGYNYFDGTIWGDPPTVRIEPERCGWPAYAPYGENGEIVVSHIGTVAGLRLSKRAEKGTGTWEFSTIVGPPEVPEYLWPRMTTGGVDNSVIHLLPITAPVANGGAIYNGIDGALLYSRSTDGGVTWDPQYEQLPGTTSQYHLAFPGDTYEIRARGDVVAALYGDSFQDLTLIKSTDGGDTWTSTVIWECPYPVWNPNAMYATDTFYCADGAHHLTIDMTGKVHVAFGINRAYSDGAGAFWFPYVDGLGYWNEDRPTFSNHRDALCPYSDCTYTELVEDYSLIGWGQDINNNGTWDVLGEAGAYYVGASSMPQIIVDDNNYVYVVYAGITETFNNQIQDYRRLWARVSPNGGEWWGPFTDLTGTLAHLFDECVFPAISQNSDDFIYLCYQLDPEPGLAVRGDGDPYGDNYINFMKVSKTDLEVGVIENSKTLFDVAQNSPNPFRGSTSVAVNVHEACNLSLEVTNMTGQVVYSYNAGRVSTGMTRINIDGSNLSKGLYFYTVRAGEGAVTRKMIVE